MESQHAALTAFYADGRLERHRLHMAGVCMTENVSLLVRPSNGKQAARFFTLDPENSGYATIEPIPGHLLTVAIPEFHFFDEPRQSLSGSSGALYLGRSREKRFGWLLQVLPPWQMTSRHEHWVKRERFINLAGSCFLGAGNAELHIHGGDMIVQPRTPHYLRTEGEYALNLLIITGYPDPELNLSMEDHHYLPYPKHLFGPHHA